MMKRFIEVANRGDSEAYLSWIPADQPVAELIFINTHGWYHEDEPLPDQSCEACTGRMSTRRPSI